MRNFPNTFCELLILSKRMEIIVNTFIRLTSEHCLPRSRRFMKLLVTV